MGSLLAILGANPNATTVTVTCNLVVEKSGNFAGFVPVELLQTGDVLATKKTSLRFAEKIVEKVTAEQDLQLVLRISIEEFRASTQDSVVGFRIPNVC